MDQPASNGKSQTPSPVGSSEMLAAWHARLTKLAREKNVAWMISANMFDHHEAFMEGLTPEEELDEQIDAARRSS